MIPWNQNDLTLGDIVKYLMDDPDISVIAVYAEVQGSGRGWSLAGL